MTTTTDALTDRELVWAHFATEALSAFLQRNNYTRSNNRGQPVLDPIVAHLAFEAADLMLIEMDRRRSPPPPMPFPSTAMREAEASVALDKGDGQTQFDPAAEEAARLADAPLTPAGIATAEAKAIAAAAKRKLTFSKANPLAR
jgi:hypothetical protein